MASDEGPALKRAKIAAPVDVLMIGTGEYTTGYGKESAKTDKGAGVVGLTMFDLRRRGKTNRLAMCGVNGKKFPQIRAHMQAAIGDVYADMDLTCETFPADDAVDSKAYLTALSRFKPGDAITIFTPDDTHFDIAMEAVRRGLHVLCTKPVVKTIAEHRALASAALEHNVLVAVEVHKRFDPIYVDARDRIASMGAFSYLDAYMSQPKHQLETFRAWAGKSSDISYYLNSHHIDFHEWSQQQSDSASTGRVNTTHLVSRPVRVTAAGARGVADEKGIATEDTITLLANWESVNGTGGAGGSGAFEGVASYTSSWIAPRADVHSQQRFFYMGTKGEVRVDQAHRGYSIATDASGFSSVNPLFMKYTPTNGRFAGQTGYGYKSFEHFIDAVQKINSGDATPADFNATLATIHTTYCTTAILEAGRLSLDHPKLKGMPHLIVYGDDGHPEKIVPAM